MIVISSWLAGNSMRLKEKKKEIAIFLISRRTRFAAFIQMKRNERLMNGCNLVGNGKNVPDGLMKLHYSRMKE